MIYVFFPMYSFPFPPCPFSHKIHLFVYAVPVSFPVNISRSFHVEGSSFTATWTGLRSRSLSGIYNVDSFKPFSVIACIIVIVQIFSGHVHFHPLSQLPLCHIESTMN